VVALKIRAVLFDLGNTLVRTWIPEVTYRKVLGSMGINRSIEEIKEALSRTEKEFKESNCRSMYGKVKYVEYWEKWDSQILRNLGVAEDESLAREVMGRWYDHADCVAYSDAKETLTRLKKRNLKLGLISTGYEEDINAIFQKGGLEKGLFDVVVGANTIEKEKPDPEVFKHALKMLQVKPKEALFVGDKIDEDYEGAERVGIHALLIQREQTGIGTHFDLRIITSLEEILKFVDQ
jgi:putative hydrolase of the HAD superfamily